MKNIRQAGFSVVEVVVVLTVLATVAALGYFAMNRMDTDTASTPSSTTTTQSSDDLAAPDIKTKSDLTDAQQTLDSDSADLDAADSELNAQTDAF